MDEAEDLAQSGREGADPPIDTAQNDAPVSVDDLASEMGWSPKDKWKGDPEKWKPADEFMRRTVDVNRSLADRLKGMEGQIETMARTSATITERAVLAERERVLAERHEAIEMGDHKAVDAADKKLETLNVTIAPPKAPEVAKFEERNASWFQKDPDATRWAINRAGQLAESGIGSAARQLDIVEREAKQLFPEFFQKEEPASKGADLTRPGARGGAPRGGKTFADLPKSAQAVALDYEKRGIFKRDDYVKTYFEEQDA